MTKQIILIADASMRVQNALVANNISYSVNEIRGIATFKSENTERQQQVSSKRRVQSYRADIRKRLEENKAKRQALILPVVIDLVAFNQSVTFIRTNFLRVCQKAGFTHCEFNAALRTLIKAGFVKQVKSVQFKRCLPYGYTQYE